MFLEVVCYVIGVPVLRLLAFFHLGRLLFLKEGDPKFQTLCIALEIVTVCVGIGHCAGYADMEGICFTKEWTEQLYNQQKHTPIAAQGWPILLLFLVIGVFGYLILRDISFQKTPPLVVVAGIACSYTGVFVLVLWCIQICRGKFWVLALLPVNCVLLLMIQIKNLILKWNALAPEERKAFRNPVLNKCNEKLQNAAAWPVAALVLFVPLMGILIGMLVLLGQEPDAVIQTFTQTSGWNLSTQTSPQNLYRDEHYLCTVAAGGHRKVVKPLRMGSRHGHPVIVNRQLCVANAFEQILEEKLPKTHRAVRKFYDTYGFPVAKLIHSPFAADVVYVLMKPLEWLFLLVLYFTDAKPENRIAIQYLPPEDQRRLRELLK